MTRTHLEFRVRGVGGQLLSLVVAELSRRLISVAEHVHVIETFGMAQRGGMVGSTIDAEFAQDIGPSRTILLGLELIEGARALERLVPGDQAFIATNMIFPPGQHGRTNSRTPQPSELHEIANDLGIELRLVDQLVDAPWQVVRAAMDAGVVPGIHRAASSRPPPEGALLPELAPSTLVDRWRTLSREQRIERFESYLRETIGRIRQMPEHLVGRAVPLKDLGFDSASTVSLQSEVERGLGVSISVPTFFNRPTVAQLALHLEGRCFDSDSVHEAPMAAQEVAQVSNVDTTPDEVSVDALSDAEVLALLSEKLGTSEGL